MWPFLSQPKLSNSVLLDVKQDIPSVQSQGVVSWKRCSALVKTVATGTAGQYPLNPLTPATVVKPDNEP